MNNPIASVWRMLRDARTTLRSARTGILHSKLEGLRFNSGLGDSAHLLYAIVRSAKPNVAVEIGSARGRSTCFMGMALKDNGFGKLYAIDPHIRTAWNDYDSVETHEVLKENVKVLGLTDHVQILRKESGEVAKSWNKQINILFIDGDHSYEGVKRDWEMFSPFVADFGIVIFHDTIWDLRPDPAHWRADIGVPKFVEELRENGYPVITFDRDCGVSIVQPTVQGIPLRLAEPELSRACPAGGPK